MPNEKWVCQECIGDENAKKTALSAVTAVCAYCREEKKAVPLGVLAQEFTRHFHRNYRPDLLSASAQETVQYWDKPARTMAEIIAIEVAPRGGELAADLLNALMAYIAELDVPVAPDAVFRKWNTAGDQFAHAWRQMCTSLDVTRYFNPQVAGILSEAFDGIQALQTKDGKPIIVEVPPGDPLARLYRARVFQDESLLQQAMKTRESELGPPPADFATQGRMNAGGVSVFYGATREDVAISEVRPPVGSFVAIGQFAVTKKVRLLDLTRFKEVANEEPKAFDLGGWLHADRIEFIRQLEALLIKPIMPGSDRGYLITQVISDYLAAHQKLRLDGIVFPSVQIKWDDVNPPLNVVLFNKASGVHGARSPHIRDTLQLTAAHVRKIRAATYLGDMHTFPVEPDS